MAELREAGRGLHLVFLGQIVSIIAVILILIPIVGTVAALAGFVIGLYGLYVASRAMDGYNTALYCMVGGIVINVISVFVSSGIIGIISSLLNLAIIYCVCTVTAGILDGLGGAEAHDTARRGLMVWKINLGCTIVEVICSVLAFIPLVNILAFLVSMLTSLVALVGGILYLMFLYKSSNVLMTA